jgi:cytochrome c-type biogenesis protein CcmF
MAWDRKLSVGTPFFEKAFTPFMVALAMVLPLGRDPAVEARQAARALRPLRGALALRRGHAAGLCRLDRAFGAGGDRRGLGSWLIAGAMAELWLRTGKSGGSRLRACRAPIGARPSPMRAGRDLHRHQPA